MLAENLQSENTPKKNEVLPQKDSNQETSSQKPFINEQEQKILIEGWKQSVEREKGKGYTEIRHEGMYDSPEAIEYIHSESFLDYINSEIKGGKTSIKVLDIGGGIGVYAEQIRKKFGDKVHVVTTGLSRSHVSRQRKSSNLKLPDGEEIAKQKHKDDLVCQSILQMKNFPEFDLIIDTFAEQLYIEQSFLDRYFEAVASKLKNGGKASISCFGGVKFTEIKEKLEGKYPVKVHFTYSQSKNLQRIKQLVEKVKLNDNHISQEDADTMIQTFGIEKERLLQNPMKLLKHLEAWEENSRGRVLKIEKLK